MKEEVRQFIRILDVSRWNLWR